MTSVSVRYIVDDVTAAISFYTDLLNFKLEMNPAPGFALLSRGDLHLLLNAPGAGGAGQAMPDGQMPRPGGWNRIQIAVDDLISFQSELASKGASFKNEITEGQGGKQLLLQDPSGNLCELFEAKKAGFVKAIPDGFHTVTPFLLADDVAQFLSFIERAFSAKTEYTMKSSDGVVRHATARIGSSILMVSSGTDIYGNMPCMLHLYVKDVDSLYAQAIKAGAASLRKPQNEFYGDRTSAVVDSWKNQWWIATHVEDVPEDELQRREQKFREQQ
jgi:uncharacterized glyoxalase superfamily protein PhnB/catechol 2,3-dioxygenase-like lactoylglutathione lyase family enzyme